MNSFEVKQILFRNSYVNTNFGVIVFFFKRSFEQSDVYRRIFEIHVSITCLILFCL